MESKPAPKRLEIKLDPATHADVEALAARWRTTAAAAVRRAVVETADRELRERSNHAPG